MADQKISELTALTGANVADDDAIAIVDTSATETKKIVFSELKNALDTATGFVRITGDTMTGALDVQSTITADGLTVDGSGTAQITSTSGTTLELIRSGTAGQISSLIMKDGGNAQNRINSSGGALEFEYGASNLNALKIANNGDISFFEDTGTTAKLFWDASAERLGIGTTSPSRQLHVSGSGANTRLRVENTTGSSVLDVYAEDGGNSTLNYSSVLTMSESGTERMRIDSSGNLLVGKTSADNGGTVGHELHSNDTAYHTRSGGAGVIVNRLSSDGNIAVFQKDGTTVGSISSFFGNLMIGKESGARIAFSSTGIYSSNNSGTTEDASYSLGTASSRFTDLYLSGFTRYNTEVYVGNGASISGSYSDNDLLLHTDNNPIVFRPNGSEAMRIDSSGRVMIAETSNSGYSNNADDLIVGDNGSATERGISLGSTLASTIRFNDGSDAGTIEYVHSDNSMRFGTTNGSERMRIDSSGNVGIGTDSPSSKLHVNGIAKFDNYIHFGGSISTPATAAAIYRPADNQLAFSTANNERMRISSDGSCRWTPDGSNPDMTLDASGNLLVGDTSATFNDTAKTVIRPSSDNWTIKSGVAHSFNRTGGDGDILEFYSTASTKVGSIGTRNGDLTVGTGGVGLQFEDSTNTIDPVSLSTNAKTDGVVNLGEGSARFKDLYLSGGVYLGGTGSANKLDDYEEGTWIPTAAQGITGLTVVKAIYTKVGRSVTVMGYLSSMSGKNSSHLQIGGLPFTPDTQHYSTGVLECGTSGQMGIVRTDANNTYLVFYKPASDNTRTNLVGNDVGSSHIIFSITYQTT